MEENTINQENPVFEIGIPKLTKRSNPQLTEEEMFQVIKDFQASGLTRRKFCLEHDYPMSNFYYWQKKYYQKFPEEVDDKPKRGRKPKADSVAENEKISKSAASKSKKTSKTKKGKKSVDKKVPTPATADLIEVSAEPKKRGRPRKADSAMKDTKIPVPKVKAAKSVITTPKATAKGKKVSDTYSESPLVQGSSGPIMQIRYPNGVRISLPADVDIKRIKELLSL